MIAVDPDTVAAAFRGGGPLFWMDSASTGPDIERVPLSDRIADRDETALAVLVLVAGVAR